MSDNDPSDSGGLTPTEYWRKNIACVLWLLLVWFIVSYGCAILFVDELDKVRIPGTGFKLGFWFAQQGAVFTFILLIVAYALRMRRLDQQFGVDDGDEPDSYDQLPQENPEEGVAS